MPFLFAWYFKFSFIALFVHSVPYEVYDKSQFAAV